MIKTHNNPVWRVLSGMFKEKNNVKNLGFTNI